MPQQFLRSLIQPSRQKIVLIVADGLGGLPQSTGGDTALEAANTPHLDRLAESGTTGLLHPIMPGITCGSGPGHLALFGYDPLEHQIGRGVLSALGIGFDLQPGDVAFRGNFCTLDDDGKVTDRRAGRIDDSQGRELVNRLNEIEVDGVEVFVRHVKQYRFAVVFRGQGLTANVSDSDPRITGVGPKEIRAGDESSERTAGVASKFLQNASDQLKDQQPANMVLLRGAASLPDIAGMKENYGTDACAIAIYPMYRGLSRLLGMKVPEPADGLEDQVRQMSSRFDAHDFFFLHHKDTDSLGEDGNFDRKVQEIERLDTQLPRILEWNPDVVVVTGDHSTPAAMKSHSWHPVPVVLSAETCRPDRTQTFGEREAIGGGLGQIQAKHLMPLMLAHAGRLDKFGA